MPTRKQRRQRAKTFRHEYDLVTYDDEGNEVPFEAPEVRKEKEPAKAKTRTNARPVREVPPPSWRRAVRRGGLMGILLLLLMLTFVKGSPVIPVIYALLLIPFTYWMDRFAYRNYLRRTGKAS